MVLVFLLWASWPVTGEEVFEDEVLLVLEVVVQQGHGSSYVTTTYQLLIQSFFAANQIPVYSCVVLFLSVVAFTEAKLLAVEKIIYSNLN